jgi:hypothetical protein
VSAAAIDEAREGEMGPVGFDLDMTLIDSRSAILASFAGLGRDTATAIDLAAGSGSSWKTNWRSGTRRISVPRRPRSTGVTTCG